jgi:hypothetical protein
MVWDNICGGRAIGVAFGITMLAILLIAEGMGALSHTGWKMAIKEPCKNT